MKTMLMRESEKVLAEKFKNGQDYSILNAGEYYACPHTEDMTSRVSVNVNLKEKELTVLGS